MSTCDLGFDHPDPEPAVEVVEAPDVEPIADATVEVARIEAERDVTLAKIQRSTLADEERIELEALRVEVGALREQLAPPPPEEVPVVVEAAPEPEPEPESAPPVVEETSTPEPAAKKRSNPWWG